MGHQFFDRMEEELSSQVVTAPSVYLIYGTPGSGRKELLVDLVDGGINGKESVAILLPEEESSEALDTAGLSRVKVYAYQLKGDKIVLVSPEDAVTEEVVFILAPGLAHPGDVAEATKNWIDSEARILARVLTVVDCARLEAHPGMRAWVDACVHFADVVLLNRREQVSNRWIKDFEDHFRKACFPCHFFFVKKGRVRNPAEVLDPEPRRISLYFDTLEPIEEDDLEEADQPEDLAEDPYLVRHANGQRAKRLPDLKKYLTD